MLHRCCSTPKKFLRFLVTFISFPLNYELYKFKPSLTITSLLWFRYVDDLSLLDLLKVDALDSEMLELIKITGNLPRKLEITRMTQSIPKRCKWLENTRITQKKSFCWNFHSFSVEWRLLVLCLWRVLW